MSGDNGLPDGLTKDALVSILKKDCQGDVEVIDIETNGGATKGDHYLSEINRIKVKFMNNNVENVKSFILKDVSESPLNFIAIIQGTEKENSWYEEVQPKVNRTGVNFGAQFYLKHRDWLLLEDLCASGFKTADRTAFLDENHCVEAMKSLAKFHAVTHKLYETGELPEITCRNTQYTPERETDIYYNFQNFDEIADNLNECGGEKYSQYIRDLKSNAWQKMLKCLDHDDFELKCLTHGDYWTTNILFKYDSNNKVSEAKIIDFQLLKLSNPFYDIHFFICTSIQPQVRENSLGIILKAYLETLNSTFEQLGLKQKFTSDQFHKSFEETMFMGLFFTLTFLQVPLCDPKSPLTFDPPENATDEEKRNFKPFTKVYKQQSYRNHLLSLLAFYSKKNVI